MRNTTHAVRPFRQNRKDEGVTKGWEWIPKTQPKLCAGTMGGENLYSQHCRRLHVFELHVMRAARAL